MDMAWDLPRDSRIRFINLRRWDGLIDMRYAFMEINSKDYHVRTEKDVRESGQTPSLTWGQLRGGDTKNGREL